MKSQIYFDNSELRKGYFYNLESEILSEDEFHFELGDWVGRGGNASVFTCTNKSSGEEFAIKFLLNSSDTNIKRFYKEIELLKQLDSDHIAKYKGTGKIRVSSPKKKDQMEFPFLIMDLAECNLQESLKKSKSALRSEHYIGQFRGLAQALALLHTKAVHRDIKPENILIAGDRWLLSDYGLCSYVNEGNDLTPEDGNVGPKFWYSPEAHNKRLGNGDTISTSSDVYQLAAVFWYVVTGRHPSGILTKSDWNGPEKLFDLIYKSLYHDCRVRPKDGQVFLDELNNAIMS